MSKQTIEIAKCYRSLVEANSFPGEIKRFDTNIDESFPATSMYSSTNILCLMLLDTEVTYKIVGENDYEENKKNKIIKELTYSVEEDICNADYVIVSKEVDKYKILEIISELKKGTLVDPHTSATLIIEVSSLYEGDRFICSGPGIEKEKEILIKKGYGWYLERNNKNKEFPLGIDIILVDKDKNILAIPRTTNLERI